MALKETSTITSKGQVTIPRAVREELDLQAGDQLSWSVSEDGSLVV